MNHPNERQSDGTAAQVPDNIGEPNGGCHARRVRCSSSVIVGEEQSQEDVEGRRESLLRRLESFRSGLLDGGYINHLLRCATEPGYLEARAKMTESQVRSDREQYDLWLKHYGPDPVKWIQATIQSTERDLSLLPPPTNHSIEFHTHGNTEVGRLEWNDGTLRFTGNADESARVFFRCFAAQLGIPHDI